VNTIFCKINDDDDDDDDDDNIGPVNVIYEPNSFI